MPREGPKTPCLRLNNPSSLLPLRSLRLCVRLYWRSVSTGHDREIAPTGGCPSNMLRMVPLLLRNAYGFPILGRICTHPTPLPVPVQNFMPTLTPSMVLIVKGWM